MSNAKRQAQEARRLERRQEEENRNREAKIKEFFDQGVACQQRGDFTRAISFYQAVTDIDPKRYEAYSNMGNCFYQLQNLQAASGSCMQAIYLRPDIADHWHNHAIVLLSAGAYEDCETQARRALEINPDYIESWNAISVSQYLRGQMKEALATAYRMVEIDPNYSTGWTNISNTHLALQQWQLAAEAADKAVTLNPRNEKAWNNYGVSVQHLGDLNGALAKYEQAMEILPGFVEAELNHSMLLMKLGRLKEGWVRYECRWRSKSMIEMGNSLPQPQWTGQDVCGKKLLLICEQGFGDSLQFIRYAALFKKLGATVFVGNVNSPLARLFEQTPGIDALYIQGAPLPAFDYAVPLMSIPRHIWKVIPDIDERPWTGVYLSPKPTDVVKWYNRVEEAARGDLKVGLVWAGDPRKSVLEASLIDTRRSMRFDDLAPFINIPGIKYFSLQKGEPAKQLGDSHLGDNIVDWKADLLDFNDTAALIVHLDVVVTVDTSVCHLAAGMGKKVLMLSRYDGCWRWGIDETVTPYYPSMTILRQPTPGDWKTPVEQAKTLLCSAVQSQKNEREEEAVA